ATDVPASRAEVRDYFETMRPRLTVSEETLRAIRFLRSPYGTDPLTRSSSQLISRVATELLPPWAKDLLGLRPPPSLGPLAARTAGHGLTRALRAGVHYRQIDEAYVRAGRSQA